MTCRCSKFRPDLLRYRHEQELPESLRKVLRQCPDCRAYFQQACAMGDLIALKQYERPEPMLENRVRSQIRRELRAFEAEQKPQVEQAWWMGAWAGLRVGVAALLMAFLGVHLLSVSELSVLQSPDDFTRSLTLSNPPPEVHQNPEFPVALLSNWMNRAHHSSSYQFIGLDR